MRKLSPDEPEVLVTCGEATQLFPGVTRGTIDGWRVGGHLKGRRVPPSGVRSAGPQPLSYVYRLGDIKKLVEAYQRRQTACPPGHVHSDEAAAIIGCSLNVIRTLCRDGVIPSVKVRYSIKADKFIWYCDLGAVEKYAHAKQLERHAAIQQAQENKKPDRPLIAADNFVCLSARRELWEKSGRKFQKVS